MKRCLHTARLVLDTESMKKKGVNLKVEAHIREALASQCDFPYHIQESMKSFSEFDFSRIEKDIDELGEFFIANYLENKKSAQDLKEIAKKFNSIGNIEEKGKAILKYIKEKARNRNPVESQEDTYKRAQTAKKIVKEYIKQNEVKDYELVLVSHGNFIRGWTSSGFNKETNSFINDTYLQNCELLEIEL